MHAMRMPDGNQVAARQFMFISVHIRHMAHERVDHVVRGPNGVDGYL